MSYKIITTTPKDLSFSDFEKLPQKLYPKENLQYLTSELSAPFPQENYLLLKNEKPVARATLFFNPKLKYQNQPAAALGNYECEDNFKSSQYLLNFISKEAKQKGIKYLIGPMHGSTWSSYRFCNSNSLPPFFMEPYQHLYYNEHFLVNHFKEVRKYISNIASRLSIEKDNLEQLNQKFSYLRFRHINLNCFEKELKKIYDLCIQSFAGNFLFTPIPFEYFYRKHQKIKPYLHPEWILLAEDEEELIGFLFAVKDIYVPGRLIIKTLARLHEDKYKGLGKLLTIKIIEQAQKQKLNSVIHALIDAENISSNVISEELIVKKFRSYSLYSKKI